MRAAFQRGLQNHEAEKDLGRWLGDLAEVPRRE
jgi:hypothetical protein